MGRATTVRGRRPRKNQVKKPATTVVKKPASKKKTKKKVK